MAGYAHPGIPTKPIKAGAGLLGDHDACDRLVGGRGAEFCRFSDVVAAELPTRLARDPGLDHWLFLPPPGGDIPDTAPGNAVTRTFPTRGDYDYFCTHHDDMKGRVRIE